MEELWRKIEQINITQEDRIMETFKTVQHLEAKIDALSAMINLMLAKSQNLSEEEAQEFYVSQLDNALTLKLQKLIQKYG